MNDFPKRLKEMRIQRGLTQKALADYLGIGKNAYQNYEYGKREPNYETLAKLSIKLNVSSDYLIGITDEP